jgi:hypothetical protein
MDNPELGKFEIGDNVIVQGEFKTEYNTDGNKVPIEISFKTPKFGIICGATHKNIGKYKGYNALRSYHSEFDDDGPYLSVEKVFTVWLVRLGLLNSPLTCLSGQLKKYFLDDFKLPIRYYAHK